MLSLKGTNLVPKDYYWFVRHTRHGTRPRTSSNHYSLVRSKRLRLTALHDKLTLGGEKNSRRYPPLALTSLSLHFCQSGLSSKAQSPTMKLTFASFSHSTTIRDILRFLSENEALINNRFSIRSSGSLRLDSKIRRLRHGTWQMILYLSTLSLGIITFCGTAVSNVSHIISLSIV